MKIPFIASIAPEENENHANRGGWPFVFVKITTRHTYDYVQIQNEQRKTSLECQKIVEVEAFSDGIE